MQEDTAVAQGDGDGGASEPTAVINAKPKRSRTKKAAAPKKGPPKRSHKKKTAPDTGNARSAAAPGETPGATDTSRSR